MKFTYQQRQFRIGFSYNSSVVTKTTVMPRRITTVTSTLPIVACSVFEVLPGLEEKLTAYFLQRHQAVCQVEDRYSKSVGREIALYKFLHDNPFNPQGTRVGHAFFGAMLAAYQGRKGKK